MAKGKPRLPPRWFIRSAWIVHRALYSISGGRFGLRSPTAERYGMLRITTIGRRTGQERKAILGYFEDGPDLFTLAMNGWGEGSPAWWLNLLAHPEATVELAHGSGPVRVRARAATEDEQPRLWARMKALESDLDGYAAMRSQETPVVILEPQREA